MEDVLGFCALVLTILMSLAIAVWFCCSIVESIVKMRRRHKKLRHKALLRENERLKSFLEDAAEENARFRKRYHTEIIRRKINGVSGTLRNGTRRHAREVATDAITLTDSGSVPSEASPVTGIAGLYAVTISEEGWVRGSSETGGRLEAQIGKDPQEGGYSVTGIVTPADGGPRGFGLSSPSVKPGNHRVVVLADRKMRKRKKGTGKTTWEES